MRKVKNIIGKKFKESILGNLLAISIKLIKLPILGLTFDESVNKSMWRKYVWRYH